MKKRSRCVRCGHFLSNGKYCKKCVKQYKEWSAYMDEHSFYSDPISISNRQKKIKTMEAEMEH